MEHVTNPQLAKAIQFMQPEKALPFAPALDAALLAALFGTDEETYRATRRSFVTNARAAAQELLADPAFAARVDQLPFASRATVVGVGDSITADLQSWLEILRHLLELRRPYDRIQVINEGVADQTSALVLRRFTTIVTTQPDWIICAVGAADALRVGPAPVKTVISLEETAKNLAALRDIATTKTTARWVWMTPPTVAEERVAANPFFQRIMLTLRNDDLAAVGDVLARQPDPVVDIQAVFGCPPDPALHLPDGMHPSLAGQRAIARALVERLTA